MQLIEIDGVAYWMGNNGFFSFDGTVNTLPCSVEDYVYDDIDTTKGQQINAGINNLFTEVIMVVSNIKMLHLMIDMLFIIMDKTMQDYLWVIGIHNTNTNSMRTTWIDSLVYPKPYATAYNSSGTGTFPAIVGETGLGQTVFFEHEIGTDQVNPDGSTTALTSFITII